MKKKERRRYVVKPSNQFHLKISPEKYIVIRFMDGCVARFHLCFAGKKLIQIYYLQLDKDRCRFYIIHEIYILFRNNFTPRRY